MKIEPIYKAQQDYAVQVRGEVKVITYYYHMNQENLLNL